jgi:pimeloyl-ACP methyl ester carboxylesterase
VSDIEELRRLLSRGLYRAPGDEADALEALERAIELTRATFAEGLVIDECDELSAWLEREREALHAARRQALAKAASLHERAGRNERALALAAARVASDPLDEDGHRQLMRLHAAGGRSAAALEQFERCREALATGAGVEPEPATQELATALRTQVAPGYAERVTVPEVHFTRSGDIHLAYQVCGQGPVDLLVIGGFVSHLEQAWEPGGPGLLLQALARRLRVIVYDRRGVGLSDRTVDPADVGVSSLDALAVLDAAGSRRALVFAFSEGGPIGVRLASEHPERIRGLVLWGTLAKGTASADYPFALTEVQLARWAEHLTAQWGGPAGIEAFAPDETDDPVLRRWWARLLRQGSSPGCVRGVLRTLALTDVREALPRVATPTVVLHRTGDRAVRVEAGRDLVRRLPGARWIELPGTGHWWWRDDTGPLLQALEALAVDAGKAR